MTTIPHDITITAIRIAQSAPCVVGTDVGPLREAIEQALVAERERVPREPTPKMLDAGADPDTGDWHGQVYSGAVGGAEREMAGFIWRAMFDAADAESPADWKDPKWAEQHRVHNWRNYISDELRAMWQTFPDEQKRAIAKSAEERASHEEWD